MKFFYILLALILIGGGIYWYSESGTDQLEMGDEDIQESTETNTMESDESTQMDESGSDNVVTDVKSFTVTGHNFAFSQEEIVVTEGDTVTINFSSTEGFHDWVVDEFDAATDKVQAGEETSVTFVASSSGEFEFYCSVGNHRAQGMVGKLVVEPKSEVSADMSAEVEL